MQLSASPLSQGVLVAERRRVLEMVTGWEEWPHHFHCSAARVPCRFSQASEAVQGFTWVYFVVSQDVNALN